MIKSKGTDNFPQGRWRTSSEIAKVQQQLSAGWVNDDGKAANDDFIIESALADSFYYQYIQRNPIMDTPTEMSNESMKRIMYYRPGPTMFYFDEIVGKFRFLKCQTVNVQVKDKKGKVESSYMLDYEGIPARVKPIAFAGMEEALGSQAYLDKFERNVVQQLPLVSSFEEAKKVMLESCVLFFDRTPGISYFNPAYEAIDRAFARKLMSILKDGETKLAYSLFMAWVSAKSPEDFEAVEEALGKVNFIDYLRKKGPFVPIQAAMDLQQGRVSMAGEMTEHWAAFEALNNKRLTILGTPNDGSVQKRAQVLDSEIATQGVQSQGPLFDNYFQLQRSCLLCDAIWGLGMYVAPDAVIAQMRNFGVDQDGDLDGDELDGGHKPAPAEGGQTDGDSTAAE